MALTDDIPSTDFNVYNENMLNVALMVESTEDTFTNRAAPNGVAETKTFAGMTNETATFIASISTSYTSAVNYAGWEIIGEFASGLTITAANQVLSYTDGFYRCLETLPYTTDGATPEDDTGEWAIALKYGEELPVPDVSLPFGNKVIETLDGDLNIFRGTSIGNINKSGVIETITESDELGISVNGACIYGSYTNYFETPFSPTENSITLPADNFTFWIIGSGSIKTRFGTVTEERPLFFASEGEILEVEIDGAIEFANLTNTLKKSPPLTADNVFTRGGDNVRIEMINNFPANNSAFSIVLDCPIPLIENTPVFLEPSNSTIIFFRDAELNILFAMRDIDGNTPILTIENIDDSIHRFAIVFDGQNVLFYMDGVFIKSGIVNGSDLSFSTLYIGSASGSYMGSEMANFKIYHSALTPGQVFSLGGA